MNKIATTFAALGLAGLTGCAGKEIRTATIDERLSNAAEALVLQLKQYEFSAHPSFPIPDLAVTDAKVDGYNVTLAKVPVKADYNITSICITAPDGLEITDSSGVVRGKTYRFGAFDLERSGIFGQDGISGTTYRTLFSRAGEEVRVPVTNPTGEFAKELYEEHLCGLLNNLQTRRSEVESRSRDTRELIRGMQDIMAPTTESRARLSDVFNVTETMLNDAPVLSGKLCQVSQELSRKYGRNAYLSEEITGEIATKIPELRKAFGEDLVCWRESGLRFSSPTYAEDWFKHYLSAVGFTLQ